MSEELTQEDIHRAVDRAVEEMLESAGLAEAPVDAVALALHLGIEVQPEEEDSAPRRRARQRPALRPDHTPEQLHWAAAHQIGKHIQGELLSRLGISGGRRPLLGVSLAKVFADHLLVPAGWLEGEARAAGFDLFALKERFDTAGHDVIAWRLLDLDQPCIITVIDNGHVARRRSNAWRVTKELSSVEENCQRQVHRYSRPCRVSEEGWDVQGWPVHRADWRREILRSVVEE